MIGTQKSVLYIFGASQHMTLMSFQENPLPFCWLMGKTFKQIQSLVQSETLLNSDILSNQDTPTFPKTGLQYVSVHAKFIVCKLLCFLLLFFPTL